MPMPFGISVASTLGLEKHLAFTGPLEVHQVLQGLHLSREAVLLRLKCYGPN